MTFVLMMIGWTAFGSYIFHRLDSNRAWYGSTFRQDALCLAWCGAWVLGFVLIAWTFGIEWKITWQDIREMGF